MDVQIASHQRCCRVISPAAVDGGVLFGRGVFRQKSVDDGDGAGVSRVELKELIDELPRALAISKREEGLGGAEPQATRHRRSVSPNPNTVGGRGRRCISNSNSR